MTKEEIVQLSFEKVFLDSKTKEYTPYADLDAAHARAFLEAKGFEVIKNYDTGFNGWAITSCGIKLSTNGFLSRIEGV